MIEKIKAVIDQYTSELRHANKEEPRKLRFYQAITQLFNGDEEALTTISKMCLGAEKALSIPLPSRLKTGFADTQYNHVIFEWKSKLSKSGNQESLQLAEYLLGNWYAGRRDEFILIATDGMEWHLYAPEFSPEFLINGTLPQDASEIALRRIESFSVTDSNQIDFYFFLDRYLFKTHPQKPTLSNVQLDFGDTSPIFEKQLH